MVGATVRVKKSLVDEYLKKVQADYDTTTVNEAKTKIYDECTNIAKEKYTTVTYLMGYDRKWYGALLDDLEKHYTS